MTPRKLVRDDEVERVIALARKHGLEIGGIEVSTTSVTILPASNRDQSAYGRWKKASEASDRPSHRSQA